MHRLKPLQLYFPLFVWPNYILLSFCSTASLELGKQEPCCAGSQGKEGWRWRRHVSFSLRLLVVGTSSSYRQCLAQRAVNGATPRELKPFIRSQHPSTTQPFPESRCLVHCQLPNLKQRCWRLTKRKATARSQLHHRQPERKSETATLLLKSAHRPRPGAALCLSRKFPRHPFHDHSQTAGRASTSQESGKMHTGSGNTDEVGAEAPGCVQLGQQAPSATACWSSPLACSRDSSSVRLVECEGGMDVACNWRHGGDSACERPVEDRRFRLGS